MQLRTIIFKGAGLLAMAAVLGLSTPILAAAYETWSGPINFKLTVTDQNPDGKLVKTIKDATATLEMYIVPDGGPTTDSGGIYYMRVTDPTQGLVVGITALEIVSSQIPNSKSMKIIGVGSGGFFENGSAEAVGPASLSLTGTVALDGPGGIPTSITATLTMAGGSPGTGPNGGNYIWSGKPKVVLTRQTNG
jgi:hypothetical protein